MIIIGNYYLNGVSSFNDVVRYVVFMAIPVIFYLSWKFIFEKNKPNDLETEDCLTCSA